MLRNCLQIAGNESFLYLGLNADCAVPVVPRVQDKKKQNRTECFSHLLLFFLQRFPMQRSALLLRCHRRKFTRKAVRVSPPSPNGIVASNAPRVVLAPLDSGARMQQFPEGFSSPSAGCAMTRACKTMRSLRVNSICFFNV